MRDPDLEHDAREDLYLELDKHLQAALDALERADRAAHYMRLPAAELHATRQTITDYYTKNNIPNLRELSANTK